MPAYVDIVGQRFGHIVVLERVENRYGPNGGLYVTYQCRCDCGNIKNIRKQSLTGGRTTSCGCNNYRKPPIHRMNEGMAAFRHLFGRYQKDAESRGISWELSEESFREITSKDCFYCGKSPSQSAKAGRQGLFGDYLYNGIDRRDNRHGYLIGNVVPCCGTCNRMKSSLNYDSFIGHVKKICNNFIMYCKNDEKDV